MTLIQKYFNLGRTVDESDAVKALDRCRRASSKYREGERELLFSFTALSAQYVSVQVSKWLSTSE